MSRSIERVIPVIPVRDIAASMRYYEDVFGFACEWGGEDGSHIGSVGRDDCSIMLRQENDPAPNWVWVGVEDIMPIYEKAVAAGATVMEPPRNRPWAYETMLLDLDGNVLWFGSEPLKES